jgi:hypothetical protein
MSVTYTLLDLCWTNKWPKPLLLTVLRYSLKPTRNEAIYSYTPLRNLYFYTLQSNVLIQNHDVVFIVHRSTSVLYNQLYTLSVFNLLWISSLYMFRALLAYLQEVLHKQQLVYCVCVCVCVLCLLVATRIGVPFQSW